MRRLATATSGGSATAVRLGRTARRTLFVACLSLLALAATAYPALAAQTHFFEASVGSGELSSPGGLAVDQTDGTLYVADQGSGTVHKFDAAAAAADFSALGSNQVGPFSFESASQLAVDNSGGANAGHLYVTNSLGGGVQAFDSSGEPAAFSASAGYLSGNTISGTPSGNFGDACGVAVDSNGAIYVGEYYSGQVDVYAPTGQYLTAIATGISVCNVAVDGAGNVYANGYYGSALEFTPDSFPVAGSTTYGAGTVAASGSNQGIGIDPANDNLYVNAGSYVGQYQSAANANTAVGLFGSERLSGSKNVAVDASGGAADGSVYVSNGSQVDRFGPETVAPEVSTDKASDLTIDGDVTLNGTVNPSGVELTECEFEVGPDTSYGETVPCAETPAEIGAGATAVPVHADLTGVAPGFRHFRIVAANANGRVKGQDQSFKVPDAPTVIGQSVVPTFVEANLRAVVDSGNAASSYYFEYGTTSAYGSVTETKSLGAGLAPVNVSAGVFALTPGSTYHFRVVITNPLGTAKGADQSFQTIARSGSGLPDNRGYEQVSPADKEGYDVAYYSTALSSLSGNSFEYRSNGSFAGSEGSAHTNDFIATRSPSGWTSKGLTTRMEPDTNIFAPSLAFLQFTPDLARTLFFSSNSPEPGVEGPHVRTLYLRNADGSFEQVSPTPSPNPGTGYFPVYAGGSTDLDHVFFESTVPLTPDTPGGITNAIYEWHDGTVELGGILPSGLPAEDAAVALAPIGGLSSFLHKAADPYQGVSADGTQYVFKAGTPKQLYFSVEGKPTVAISASQKAGSIGELAPNGVTFAGSASAGGKLTTLYFSSRDELTDDANAGLDPGSGQEGRDLYAYDVASGDLTDLSVDTNPADPVGARVFADWIATSTDGGYVYFIASGVLAPGAHSNEENLYLWHEGEVRFLGPSSSFSIYDSVVSPSGKRLVVRTAIPLTADDNGGFTQMYIYDAPSDTWDCASCLPGARTPSDARFTGFLTGDVGLLLYSPRNISVDGKRVFFETDVALSPSDSNGQSDVYEWEEGAVHLISTGHGASGAHFMNASASGDDVFFGTRDQVLPGDRDNNVDVYDARVGGGLSSSISNDTAPCEGDACQAPPTPPNDATPASAGFHGAGNPKQARSKARHKKPKRQRARRHHKSQHASKPTTRRNG